MKTLTLPKHIFKQIIEKEENKNIKEHLTETAAESYQETCKSLVYLFKKYTLYLIVDKLF